MHVYAPMCIANFKNHKKERKKNTNTNKNISPNTHNYNPLVAIELNPKEKIFKINNVLIFTLYYNKIHRHLERRSK